MSDHPENWGTRVTVRFLKIEQLDALVGDDGRQQQWPKPTRSSVITNLVAAEFSRRNLDAAPPINRKTVEKNATLFDDRQLEAFEKTVKKIAAATDVVEKRLKEKKPARRPAVRHPRATKAQREIAAAVRRRRSAKQKVAKKKGGRR